MSQFRAIAFPKPKCANLAHREPTGSLEIISSQSLGTGISLCHYWSDGELNEIMNEDVFGRPVIRNLAVWQTVRNSGQRLQQNR